MLRVFPDNSSKTKLLHCFIRENIISMKWSSGH